MLSHIWCAVAAASLRGRPWSWSCMLGRNITTFIKRYYFLS
ncbi:hypothetical protein CMEL01_14348 [Colletotrichum melonis]|uniref:Uncharacterized protein n=1 Tax=Colletotrichum melonis TaxID=1209925 RepID=A0AAI9UPV1_9PEZI|nr:hypothetical protein CMEL01_14348 [Colletotrichum melonis]